MTASRNHAWPDRQHDQQLLIALTSPEARMPTRNHLGDAGYDLYVSESVVIWPSEFRDVDCGMRLQLPDGYWARITGRSSTLRKRGLLVNEAVIDNGYVGPIYTGIWNLSRTPVKVAAGERLAQLILHPIVTAPVVRVLDPTELVSRDGRGDGGFGSTGS